MSRKVQMGKLSEKRFFEGEGDGSLPFFLGRDDLLAAL